MASNGSRIEIYTRDGQPLGTFDAFNSQNGVLVTTRDINNDGKAEIIAPNGSEIRIFDANRLQIDSFQVEGTIISLAFGNGIIEEVPDVIDDTSNETPTPEDSSTDESLVWIFLQLLCFNQRHCWGTALPYKMVN